MEAGLFQALFVANSDNNAVAGNRDRFAHWARTSSNDQLLYCAARSGNVETVRVLLRKLPADVRNNAAYGNTPLMVAAGEGHSSVVELLINKGANVNAVDRYRQTALHWASIYNQPHIVRVLVAQGAELNCRDKENATPLHRACHNGHHQVVKTLIQLGCNLDDQDDSGNTPLHLACQQGEIGTAKLLISEGASTRKTNIQGQSLLHVAATQEIVQALLVAEAFDPVLDLQHLDNRHLTPLQSAARDGRRSVGNYLQLIVDFDAQRARCATLFRSIRCASTAFAPQLDPLPLAALPSAIVQTLSGCAGLSVAYYCLRKANVGLDKKRVAGRGEHRT